MFSIPALRILRIQHMHVTTQTAVTTAVGTIDTTVTWSHSTITSGSISDPRLFAVGMVSKGIEIAQTYERYFELKGDT